MSTVRTDLSDKARVLKFGPGTIETYRGHAYDFRNPTSDMIEIDDIKHALSNMCRFAGHVSRFYSVAEHSVLVSRIVERYHGSRDAQRIALFHDAHEAYVWDAPRPFKPLLGDAFKEYATLADRAVALAIFGAPNRARDFHAEWIKRADNIALCAEREELMVAGPAEWEHGYEDVPPLPPLLDVAALPPLQAEYLFYDRALELGLTGGTFK